MNSFYFNLPFILLRFIVGTTCIASIRKEIMKAVIERIWGYPKNGSWSSQSRIGNVQDGISRVDGVEIDPEGTEWRKVTRADGDFRIGPVSHVSRQAAVGRFGRKVIDADFPLTMTEIPWVKEHVISGPDPTVFPDDIIGSTIFCDSGSDDG
jgi:hypothetical protein